MAKRKPVSDDKTPQREGLVITWRSALVPYEQRKVAAPQVERCLAFDPGIKNVAVCYANLTSKTLITSKIDYPPEIGSKFGQMRYLEAVVERWVRTYRPDVIIKEGPALGARFGVAQAGQIQYVIERVAFDCDVPFMTVGPTTVRRFLGTSGKNHGKSDTKLEVFKRWGAEFPSEDECDAFAVFQTGLAILRGEFSEKAEKKAKKAA